MVSSRIKRNLKFSKKEKIDILLTSTVSSFVLFFLFVITLWKDKEATGGFILSKVVILWFISLGLIYLIVYVGKITAIKLGYTAQYTAWKNGLLIGFVISFISYGVIPLLFPGLLTITRIERHRHGKLFPGENKVGIARVLFTALLSLLLVSLFASFIYFITKIEFFYYIMSAAAILLFFSLIPVNNNIGIHLFYSRKELYFLFFFFSLFFAVFTVLKLFFALILALIVGLIVYHLAKKVFVKIGLSTK